MVETPQCHEPHADVQNEDFRAIPSLWSSKIRETDKGLREEIGRRLEMIQNHINTLENRFLASKNASG